MGDIWTGVLPAPTPTCSISLDQNPIAYGSGTTLRWSSTNTDTSFYINNVGYVTANTSGSASVQPSSDTDYSGTAVGTGGTTTCAASSGTPTGTLNVTPPPNPTATIAASSTSIYAGASTNILATFAAGSGDTLTHDNIDSPVGTGLGATTNPDAGKTISFSTTTPGTYTFYARAQTSYFTSWTTYSSVTVTVSANPSCTVSISPNPIARGQSATVNWTSQNASSFSINNIGSETPNTSGQTSVSPSQSTDYTGTASAGGVNNTCTASSGTPLGTLNVSCTPAYSCSTNTIQYTNSSCSVSNVTTCTSPSFCSAGSSSCLYPPPGYTQSAGLTGHLQVIPSLVPQNNTTKVFWNVSSVTNCSVTGSNGDHWSGTASPPGGQVSTALTQQPTFTLSCTGLDSSTVHETVVVNILPVFQEK